MATLAWLARNTLPASGALSVTLGAVAVVIGLGNGLGSGIVNTLGADAAPVLGRPTFLGVWRELSDGGSAIGPVILSVVTGVAGLASGIVVSGVVGLAAAATLWRFAPAIRRMGHAPEV